MPRRPFFAACRSWPTGRRARLPRRGGRLFLRRRDAAVLAGPVWSRLSALQSARSRWPGPRKRTSAEFLSAEFTPAMERDRRRGLPRLAIRKRNCRRTQRTLSPSDFGFHNALLRGGREWVFLDFEYFGWDDPGQDRLRFSAAPGDGVDGNATGCGSCAACARALRRQRGVCRASAAGVSFVRPDLVLDSVERILARAPSPPPICRRAAARSARWSSRSSWPRPGGCCARVRRI